MRRPYLLGAGIATCLGPDLPSNVDALRCGKSCSTRVDVRLREVSASLPYHLIAEPAFQTGAERLYTILERVVAEALDRASAGPALRSGMGIFVGSSSFEVSMSEQTFERELATCGTGIPVPITGFGRIADRIRTRFGVGGPAYTFNTACTSSANALLYAGAMISAGWLDRAIVVGTEVFNLTTALGFHGLGLVSERGVRPFDSDRSGLVLGEAVAALVIGAFDADTRQGHGAPPGIDRPTFVLLGGANLCDTYGVTAASPDGTSTASVIDAALREAGCTPADVRAIKAHGTASELNDEAEAAGMLRVFDPMPPIAALKPYIGHTLGACGVAEIALFCGAHEAGFGIANPGICTAVGPLGVALRQSPDPLPQGAYLFDYFGFGGNNTALVLSSAPHEVPA
jgi:3-oxoacyl-[acyl-carrier-protein] synthase-1